MVLLIITRLGWLLKALSSSMELIVLIPSVRLSSLPPFVCYYLSLSLMVGLFIKLIFKMFFSIAFLMIMCI
jgi:hypothetical protein